MKTHTYDILGDFGFRVEFDVGELSVNFRCYEIYTYEDDGTPLFELGIDQMSRNHGICHSLGFVRKDETMRLEMYNGAQINGLDGLQMHCNLLKYVWSKSLSLLGNDEINSKALAFSYTEKQITNP